MHVRWGDDVSHRHNQEMGDIKALTSDISGVETVVCWKRSCRVAVQRNGKVVFHAQCHVGACSFIRDFDIHGILKIIKAS